MNFTFLFNLFEQKVLFFVHLFLLFTHVDVIDTMWCIQKHITQTYINLTRNNETANSSLKIDSTKLKNSNPLAQYNNIVDCAKIKFSRIGNGFVVHAIHSTGENSINCYYFVHFLFISSRLFCQFRFPRIYNFKPTKNVFISALKFVLFFSLFILFFALDP